MSPDKVVVLTLYPDQIAALREYSLNALDKAEKERDDLSAKLNIAMDALVYVLEHTKGKLVYSYVVEALRNISCYSDTEIEKGDLT
jgi:hypothetical protein